MALVLTTSKVCPFAARVWLTLLETGLPFTLDEVSIKAGDKPAHFTALYKRAQGADEKSDGKVPVLTDGDVVLTESAHVADYVAAKARAAGLADLLPATPQERFTSGLFTEQATGAWVKAFYAPMFAKTQPDVDAAKAALTDAAALVSRHLAAASDGPFVLGGRVTLADLLLYPFVERLCVLEALRDYSVPHEPRTARFHAWRAALEARPAVAAARQEPAFFVEAYRGYAQPIAAVA